MGPPKEPSSRTAAMNSKKSPHPRLPGLNRPTTNCVPAARQLSKGAPDLNPQEGKNIGVSLQQMPPIGIEKKRKQKKKANRDAIVLESIRKSDSMCVAQALLMLSTAIGLPPENREVAGTLSPQERTVAVHNVAVHNDCQRSRPFLCPDLNVAYVEESQENELCTDLQNPQETQVPNTFQEAIVQEISNLQTPQETQVPNQCQVELEQVAGKVRTRKRSNTSGGRNRINTSWGTASKRTNTSGDSGHANPASSDSGPAHDDHPNEPLIPGTISRHSGVRQCGPSSLMSPVLIVTSSEDPSVPPRVQTKGNQVIKRQQLIIEDAFVDKLLELGADTPCWFERLLEMAQSHDINHCEDEAFTKCARLFGGNMDLLQDFKSCLQ